MEKAFISISGNWLGFFLLFVLFVLTMFLPTQIIAYRPFPPLTISFASLLIHPLLSTAFTAFCLQIIRNQNPDIKSAFTGLPAYWKLLLLFLLYSLMHEIISTLIFYAKLPLQAANWNYTQNLFTHSILNWRAPGIFITPLTATKITHMLNALGMGLHLMLTLFFFPYIYLLLDDPTRSPWQVLTQSPAFMRGYKWKLVCMNLRFVGWWILGMVTCGLALIFVIPYYALALAAFYDDARNTPPPAAARE